MMRVRTVPARTILATEGAVADETGFVLRGTLARTRLLPDGRPHILGLVVPTGLYGRLLGGTHRHDLEALTESRLLALDRPGFERLLNEEPEAERQLLAHALDELDRAHEQVLLLNGSRIVGRVASFLLLLPQDDGGRAGGGPVVQVPLTRADLAGYLGTRTETLSRAFHELAARGVLHIVDPYRFEILSPGALRALAGQDHVQLDGSPGKGV